jgi:ABC-type transport system involved in multi-copper enzyme maturation permease subunit
MKAQIFWQQGAGVSEDEWRLQRRAWGTWLVGLFLLLVVLSEHPAFSTMAELSINEAANSWADKVIVIGSFVAMLTVPFALDRARRQRVAPIEFSKPFERLAYVLGKFIGAVVPLVLVTLLSLGMHLAITLAMTHNTPFIPVALAYLKQAVLIAFVPLAYAASLTYCLSVYIHRPILIIPLYLFYLQTTSFTQAAADAKFSWWSPMVRPDYFSNFIPPEWTPLVLAHQALYLFLSLFALALAVYGFEQIKFVDGQNAIPWWRRFRFTLPAQVGVEARMLWGGSMVAALIMAFFSLTNTLSNPQTDPVLLAEYAMFGLEFWLAVSGLLMLTGVIARDKGVGALDLVLSKPVSRWQLLRERLLPALIAYLIACVLAVLFLRSIYEQLPVLKALIVSISTGMYLGLFGMTIANITKNELAGYGAGLIYWLFEAGLDGRFTAPFFLFIVSNQVDTPYLEIWDSPWVWLPVKLGMLLLSAWLFFINGWLLDVGPQRRRAIIILALSYPILFVFGWWLVPRLIG